MSKITFTAVPAGRSDRADKTVRLRLSVLVSPKLDPGIVPSPLQSWPDYLRNLRFNVSAGKLDGATGKVKQDSRVLVPGAQRLSPVKPAEGFGSQVYQSVMNGAASKGFKEQCLSDKTTFKTYDAAAASHCLHRVTSALFAATPNRQANAGPAGNNEYAATLDKLLQEHAPFSVNESPRIAAVEKAPVPAPAAAPATPAPAPPAPPVQSFAMAVNVVPLTSAFAPAAAPAPVPERLLGVTEIVESITNGIAGRAVFEQLMRAIDRTSHAPAAPSLAATAAPLAGAPVNERAEYTQQIFHRDAFRVEDTTKEDLDAKSSADLLSIALRQTVGSIVSIDVKNPLLDVLAFWQRLHRKGDSIARDVVADANRNSPDFHQRWSLLGNYSALFHALGLVISIEWVATKADLDVLRANDVLSISLAEGSAVDGLQPESPWVAYLFEQFQPASLGKPSTPADPEPRDRIENGYLVLNETHFLESSDLDGGGQKFAQYFAALGRQKKQNGQALYATAAGAIQELFPPTSRTAGISVITRNRQDDIAKAFKKSQSFDPATDALHVEDLVRGYVVDLWAEQEGKQDGRWYSLCMRDETFALPGNPPLLHRTAEGSVKPVVLEFNEKSEGQAPIPEMYVLQSLVHWDGNCLCVPAPQHGVEPGEGKSDRGPLPLDVKIAPPTTGGRPILQPPLRAGAKYRFAIRAELLTGYIAPFSQAPVSMLPPKESGPFVLRRYEPISAPAVLPLRQVENSERQEGVFDLVLKSESAENVTWGRALRIIAPPRAEERVVRLHVGKQHVFGLCEGFRRLRRKAQDGSLQPLEPRIFDAAPRLPYLPDPLAGEVTAWLEDHVERKYYGPVRLSLSHPSRAAWPELLVHLLSFTAGGEGTATSITSGNTFFEFVPGLSIDSHNLKVQLPPGHFGTLTLQPGFGPAGRVNLMNMAWWQRAMAGGAAEKITEIAALRGDHPFLTSPIQLSLTHAVRVPMRDVTIAFSARNTVFEASKSPNTTRRLLPSVIVRDNGVSLVHSTVGVNFDRKSTGKIRANVRWGERRDNGRGIVKTVTGRAMALDELIPNHLQKPEAEQDDSKNCLLHFDPGSTRALVISVETTAVSRFREYYCSSEKEATCSRVRNLGDVEILSVKAPDEPEVAYIVPTFEWTNNAADKTAATFSRRHASSVRVYVHGPWFVSGDDELLGVVVRQTDDIPKLLQNTGKRYQVPVYNPATGSPEERYVTSWGGDPIFGLQPAKKQLYLQDWEQSGSLPAYKSSDRDSQPQHAPAQTGGACGWNITLVGPAAPVVVTVVGYQPRFDEEKNLWYADVKFSHAPRYGIFVRLALARYQPHAKAGLELSNVVMPGFSQLNADRTLIIEPKKIQRNGSQESGIAITIWGIANIGTTAGPNEFEVSLERRAYKDTHSLGWEHVSNVIQASPLQSQINVDASTAPVDQVLWYGEAIPDSCAERRIVVKEFERYEHDEQNRPPMRRVVYADVVKIG